MGDQAAPAQAQTFASVAEHLKLRSTQYSELVDGIRFFDDVILLHLYTSDKTLHPHLPSLAEAQANTKDFMSTAYPKPCQVITEEEQVGYADRVFLGCRVLSSDCRSFHTHLVSKNLNKTEGVLPTSKLVNTLKNWSSHARSITCKLSNIIGLVHRAFQFASSPPMVIPGLCNVITEASLAGVPDEVILTQTFRVQHRYNFPLVTNWLQAAFRSLSTELMTTNQAKPLRKAPGCRI